MIQQDETVIQGFCRAAEKVSAVVTDVGTMTGAFTYILDLCVGKASCRVLAPGCGEPLSDAAGRVCGEKQQKSIAAPLLDPKESDALEAMCTGQGIAFIREDLRRHVSGIDIGVTRVDFALADTGTLVIDSSCEDLRLATMVSEIHAAILPKSRIRAGVFDIERELAGRMAAGPDYCAFISGPSRTADIERVLALGVHGPLELHILLTEA